MPFGGGGGGGGDGGGYEIPDALSALNMTFGVMIFSPSTPGEHASSSVGSVANSDHHTHVRHDVVVSP